MTKEENALSELEFTIEQAPDSDAPYNFEVPSKAVIANNGGNGIVVWYTGDHLDVEINENGMGVHLSDLGLDDAPDGISIWEGNYIGSKHDTPDGWEYETECVGEFRDPTPEEWGSIQKNECPWGE